MCRQSTYAIQLSCGKFVELKTVHDRARHGFHHLGAVLDSDEKDKRERWEVQTLTTLELALLCSYARSAPPTRGRLDMRSTRSASSLGRWISTRSLREKSRRYSSSPASASVSAYLYEEKLGFGLGRDVVGTEDVEAMLRAGVGVGVAVKIHQ